VVLWIAPGAVHHFNNTFVPDPFRLLYYSVFFASGVALFAQKDRLEEITRNWAACLGLSAIAFALNAHGIAAHVQSQNSDALDRLALAASTAVFAWLSAIGWLGLFLRLVRSSSAAVRYLADASYWVYLFHMPVVGLVQVLLYPLDLPVSVKFLAAVTAGTGLGLATYQGWVRYTFIGRVLNGPRERPVPAPRWRTTLYWVLPAAAAASLLGFCLWQARSLILHDNLHPVIAGEVYRSGAPKPKRLATMISQLQLKSVVSVQGGSEVNRWYANEQAVCREQGAQLHSVDFPADGLPSRESVLQLCDLLETAPRPILFHGRFGNQQAGIAAANSQLQQSTEPRGALGQFDRQFLNFDHTPYCGTRLVAAYELWLVECGQPHSFERFRRWVANDYDAEQIAAQPIVRR
jgi:hypothetical protein